jgi:hypothetical protein
MLSVRCPYKSHAATYYEPDQENASEQFVLPSDYQSFNGDEEFHEMYELIRCVFLLIFVVGLTLA